MKMHFPSTYSLVNWTFVEGGWGGGREGGKAVDASAGYFLDKSQLIHFHKFYVMCCGTALVT